MNHESRGKNLDLASLPPFESAFTAALGIFESCVECVPVDCNRMLDCSLVVLFKRCQGVSRGDRRIDE